MSAIIRIFDKFASAWLLFWASLIVVYAHAGGLAFAGLAILLGAVGWLVWLLHRQNYPILTRSFLISVLAFALFFGWLGFTGRFSGVGPETAQRLALLMLFIASLPVFMATRTAWMRDILAHIFMATALGGVLVLAFDVASGFAISFLIDPQGTGDGTVVQRQGEAEMTVGRAHVVWAILSPLILALYATRLPKPLASLAALVFLAVLLSGTMMNRLAIVPMIVLAVLPFFLLGLKSPLWGLRLSLGTLIASILFAPLIGIIASRAGEGVMARLPMSWDHRLRMWDYSWAKIQEKPLTGNGLDISRLMDAEFTTRIGVDWPIISLHPHNAGLQTWLEAGAIGAVLLSAALATLYGPLRRLCGDDPWRGAAMTGLIMGAAIGSAVTVGAWQFWWWGLIALGLIWISLIPSKDTLLLCNLADE